MYSFYGMPAQPLTFYSNIANVKITGSELVFEFGVQFPATSPGQPTKSADFVPEVRIVLGLPALKAFLGILQRAAAHMEGATNVPQQQAEPEPGSRSTPKQ
jgi:hypothetical protein